MRATASPACSRAIGPTSASAGRDRSARRQLAAPAATGAVDSRCGARSHSTTPPRRRRACSRPRPTTAPSAGRAAADRGDRVVVPLVPARARRPPGAARPRSSRAAARLRELDLAARRTDHRRDLEQCAVVGVHRRRRPTRERLVDELGERLRVCALGGARLVVGLRHRRRREVVVVVGQRISGIVVSELFAKRAHRAEQSTSNVPIVTFEPARAHLARQLLDEPQLDRAAVALGELLERRRRCARGARGAPDPRSAARRRGVSGSVSVGTSCAIASASRRDRFDWRWTS